MAGISYRVLSWLTGFSKSGVGSCCGVLFSQMSRCKGSLSCRGQVRFYKKGPNACTVKLTITYEVPGPLTPFASVSCQRGKVCILANTASKAVSACTILISACDCRLLHHWWSAFYRQTWIDLELMQHRSSSENKLLTCMLSTYAKQCSGLLQQSDADDYILPIRVFIALWLYW